MPKIWGTLALTLLLIISASAETVFITEIEATRSLGVDYLNISGSGDIKAYGLLLENQLLLDFPGTKISKDLKITKWKTNRIKTINVKQVNTTARVIVNLNKEIDYEIINVFGRNRANVEIYEHVDYTARLFAAWEKAMFKEKGDVFKPAEYKPSLAQRDPSLSGRTIVIDPGHGGSDPGSFSIHGVPEKDLTLQTARRTAYLLSSSGATVYLTRNDNRRSNLNDIVDFTNKIKADIFISIHYNVFYKEDVSGIETYYYNRSSRELALIMHQTLLSGLKRKDRGLRRAMFYLVHHTRIPAILIEPLFISNREEERLARSGDFQKTIAQNIFRGVKTYFRSKLR